MILPKTCDVIRVRLYLRLTICCWDPFLITPRKLTPSGVSISEYRYFNAAPLTLYFTVLCTCYDAPHLHSVSLYLFSKAHTNGRVHISMNINIS